jgi:pilus assembly protein FimV
MNRPPKKTIAAALGGIFFALATSAYAAGLGKLSVNSALGQPLSAEIELVSLQPGEFEVITAKVASPEAYSDARIEYSPLLRQLRFTVERKADGRPVLKISSNAPINEPFLDVLVEMSWPSGRLVREYPILLDPPGFSEARIQPPTAAARPAPPSAPAQATAPAVAPGSPASGALPSARGESKPASGPDTYGPVKRGDTLAKIASEMKPEGISLDQMLVALFRENKQAFVNNNMNLLKTGQILRIPAAADIGKLGKAEAQKEVQVQVADWKAYREQIASAASASAAKPAASNVATGQVAPAKPVSPPAAPAADQLKIAKADAAAAPGGVAGKGTVDPKAAANAAKEDQIAKEKALAEAKSRIADLEKQKADAQKLVDLKAQPPGAKPGEAPKPAVPGAAPTTPPATQVAQVTPPPAPGATPAGSPPAAPATPPAGEAAKPAPPADGSAPPAAPKPAPKPAPKAPPPPPPEPTLMETAMEYLPYAAGVAGAGVLGVGGLLFMRRRKQAAGGTGSNTQTSSLMPSDLKPNTVTGAKAGGLVDTGNSSFLTDFDKTGPGSIDTDEVDPVAEAEVYIAYGRDAQAEEILKEAMTRDKGRHEISMKLLEIYHARKSAQAFDTVARELKEAIGESDPMWAKAAAMGASIDPTNGLYSGAGREYESTGAFAAGGTAMLAAAGASAAAAAGDAGKPDLDFDLGFDDSATTKLPAPTIDITAPNSDQPSAMADASALDFDLDLASSPAATPQSAAPAATADLDLGGGLDFDLALDTPSAPKVDIPSASAPAADAGGGFDFDLSALSLDEPAPVTDVTQKVSPVAPPPAPALDLSDLSLDLDSPGDPAPPSGGGDPSAVATKLELAKAYIEIGDTDGAKEILNEVSREGNAAQQQEAKSILAGL